MYWWTEEIKKLRNCAIKTRRRITRFRTKNKGKRNGNLEAQWREDRRRLKVAIIEAKKNAWQKLLEAINDDPWRMPYKMVRNKFRTSGLGGNGLQGNRGEP